ncbi:YhgE/Pip domain-containing protein [Leifsonia shinshuensis]|uniref:YhgE/Pip domain-containing protein n=1 Tax=Leifsonia shinshuensis TaxID=150026 RepID=A0A7G6YDH0_9MICO|nr:YhgE/Pip domain-containing protein [Leifsonia shinshuensis]QNE36535.1 YhgE/Pip domain-containing protein [Leifsonia shinshuensis]
MKIPQMIAAEFRRLTASPMSIVALIALMCVPVLYGGLYLWANQNPYANLDRIPAAIVVDDTGTTVDGKTVNYGDQVADQLIADGSFQWHRVASGSAATGVDDSKYDFSITFPSDFSTALASASGTSPQRAIVTLTTNDTNSYLASTIGTQAAEKIRTSIVKQVNEEAAQRFLLGLADIRSSLAKAEDGAAQLVDGSASAQSGASQLADGTAQLASGSQTLATKLGDLSSGAAQVRDGAAQVSAGAAQVSAGNDQLAAKANQAGQAAAKLATEAPAAGQQLIAQLTAAGVSQLVIDQVQAGLDGIDQKVQAGNTQIQSAVGQVNQLAAGSDQVAAGAAQVSSGASQVADGASQAQAGASQLASGASSAAAGSAQLRDGLNTLHDGTTQLHDGLTKGVAQIPDNSPALQKKQASTIADPVNLKNDSVTSAGTYGAGLAPFFVALAGWIGIYALFLIVKPVSRRAITALHSPVKITLAGWLTPGLLGAVQMIGLFAIVSGALGFGIHNSLGMFGMMALASVTFAAIILALNVWLGSVGQFLGLVLMVLQLVTAGGTFPWQTLPGPLAALHHVLPMSNAVDGIRQLMYGGNPATAWADAGVLAVWMLIALLVSAIGVTRMTHFRTLRDLRPSLIG